MNDETEAAAYTLHWEDDKPVTTPLAMEDLEALPEQIMETINIGCTCVYDGLLYGLTEELILGDNEPMWRQP